MNSWHWVVNMKGSRIGARKRKISYSGSSDSEGSTGVSRSSSHRNKRKRHYWNNSHDEFKKARTPTFNGEVKTDREAQAWLLGMKKYFQVQDCLGNMKARVAIFNLNGRASIWWEHLWKLKRFNDIKIAWKQFKKYFKHKYLSDRYYDDKIKELHELKLG